jgi:hypothetical protein
VRPTCLAHKEVDGSVASELREADDSEVASSPACRGTGTASVIACEQTFGAHASCRRN